MILSLLNKVAFFFLFFLIAACSSDTIFELQTPESFPEFSIPEDNIITQERHELGRQLFGDTRLSLDETISCKSCHKLEYALADNVSISPGIDGKIGKRNTPSLINVGYVPLINKDGGVTRLDLQALVPIEDEHEMGMSIVQLVRRLESDDLYQEAAQKSYGRNLDAYVISRALATYVRTFIGGTSRYDDYLAGNKIALSANEIKGKEIFNRLLCNHCHSGILFTNNKFENNGLYINYKDLGRGQITLKDSDYGKFRIPSLRNVALTAPYMHDGSLSNLEDVIRHYKSGGHQHQNKSSYIQPFKLSSSDEKHLISFLQSLTDSEFHY